MCFKTELRLALGLLPSLRISYRGGSFSRNLTPVLSEHIINFARPPLVNYSELKHELLKNRNIIMDICRADGSSQKYVTSKRRLLLICLDQSIHQFLEGFQAMNPIN